LQLKQSCGIYVKPACPALAFGWQAGIQSESKSQQDEVFTCLPGCCGIYVKPACPALAFGWQAGIQSESKSQRGCTLPEGIRRCGIYVKPACPALAFGWQAGIQSELSEAISRSEASKANHNAVAPGIFQ